MMDGRFENEECQCSDTLQAISNEASLTAKNYRKLHTRSQSWRDMLSSFSDMLLERVIYKQLMDVYTLVMDFSHDN